MRSLLPHMGFAGHGETVGGPLNDVKHRGERGRDRRKGGSLGRRKERTSGGAGTAGAEPPPDSYSDVYILVLTSSSAHALASPE